MKKGGQIYIITNSTNTVLYVGVTSDLKNIIYQHKTKHYPNSFSAKYNCTKLVYYQNFSSIVEAIAFEKKIKAGSRAKKIELINSMNTAWNDLYEEIL